MTRVMLCEGNDQAFALWQSRFTRAAAGCPGFVSLEIIPAFPGATDWRVIQRFQSADALQRWQTSAARAELLEAVSAISANRGGGFSDEVAPDFHSLNSVTEVITTDVEPGQEAAFQAGQNGCRPANRPFRAIWVRSFRRRSCLRCPIGPRWFAFARPHSWKPGLPPRNGHPSCKRPIPACSDGRAVGSTIPSAAGFPPSRTHPHPPPGSRPASCCWCCSRW